MAFTNEERCNHLRDFKTWVAKNIETGTYHQITCEFIADIRERRIAHEIRIVGKPELAQQYNLERYVPETRKMDSLPKRICNFTHLPLAV